MAGVLQAIATAHVAFAHRHLAGFVPMLNRCWGRARTVELEPAAGVSLATRCGRFCGIEAGGGIVLETEAGVRHVVAAHHVGRLREVG